MRKTNIILSVGFAILVVGGYMGIPHGSHADESVSQQAKATFAGGCFWCMEEAFEKVEGVVSAVSGYIGGQVENPTYEQVSAGGTGHTESIEITYDPSKVTYQQLLDIFWKNIDPTTPNAQFCDHGNQYRSAIFYHDAKQQQEVEESLQQVNATKSFSQPIVTEVVPATEFYIAEDYHQDYYSKNPLKYKYYKWSCGRAQRLEQLWGES